MLHTLPFSRHASANGLSNIKPSLYTTSHKVDYGVCVVTSP